MTCHMKKMPDYFLANSYPKSKTDHVRFSENPLFPILNTNHQQTGKQKNVLCVVHHESKIVKYYSFLFIFGIMP
jgi:hypothetical protein